MLRGSSTLLQRSPYVFNETIKIIYNYKELKDIDIDRYDINKEIIKDAYDKIYESLQKDSIESPTYTLISKIMLGCYGSIPAFDINMKEVLEFSTIKDGNAFVNELNKIQDFYESNFDFIKNENWNNYKKARIFDMFAFVRGCELFTWEKLIKELNKGKIKLSEFLDRLTNVIDKKKEADIQILINDNKIKFEIMSNINEGLDVFKEIIKSKINNNGNE